MSRIAGLRADAVPDGAGNLCDTLLQTLKSALSWETAVIEAAGAAMGWTGWRVPVLAEAEGLLVVLDGFIYNRDELGLKDVGSDAVAIAALYRRFGFAGALKRVNGDFALALFDPVTDELWIGRDRVGAKPLYYIERPGLFAFASRPSALLRLPGVETRLSKRFVALFAASHYRYFDNDPDASPFEGIAQLPAGCVLRYAGGRSEKCRYWVLEAQEDWKDMSEAALAERYRALLMDAVARRFAVAENPAFTLSGGMDSSSVLSCAVAISGRKQDAISTVYSDKTYDETDEIRSMLDSKVEHWHPVVIGTPDVVDMVTRMVQAHDEPVATATWLSHYLLCGESSHKGFRSLFGGLGGDELNAGEYEYFFFHFADLLAEGQEATARNEIQWWARHHDHPIYRKNPDVAVAGVAKLTDAAHRGFCRPDRARMLRYADALEPAYFDLSSFEPVMDHPFQSYLKNRTFQDIFRETAPCCLRAEDRQSTQFGLDRFDPFFDHRLIEFMFRVPGSLKIREGVTKVLLREAMRGVLPEETRTRVKKTGWNAPAHIWFSGAGREWLLDLVDSRQFRERGIYRVEVVRRLIDEHDRIVAEGAAVENHMMFLWQLLNMEIWLRHVESGTPAATEYSPSKAKDERLTK